MKVQNPSYRIILADDHAMVRQGIKKLLEEVPDFQVVAEVGDGLELFEILSQVRPDLLILDITMPHLSGIEAAKSLKISHPDLKILILTMHKSMEFLNLAIAAGTDGYLLKEDAPRELLKAINAIHRGDTYISALLTARLADYYVRSQRRATTELPSKPLTKREVEILTLIARGKTSKEIAQQLFLSLRTVQNHRTRILKKLNLKKSTDLVKYALLQGYL